MPRGRLGASLLAFFLHFVGAGSIKQDDPARTQKRSCQEAHSGEPEGFSLPTRPCRTILSSKKIADRTMDPDMKAANVAPARSNSHGVYWAALLLFVMVGLAYSNSLNAIWTLDDDPNILQNSRLHIKDLQPETLFQTFFSPLHPDENGQPGLNRPLAHLSFALNWYFGKDSPAGYRLVNIVIHFLAAFVLFLVIRDLLDTPNMRGRSPGRKGSIALVGAALWALNPIQTQAVVYIVQRMTSLACLFYLLAIWCYIRGRASEARRRRAVFFILTMRKLPRRRGFKRKCDPPAGDFALTGIHLLPGLVSTCSATVFQLCAILRSMHAADRRLAFFGVGSWIPCWITAFVCSPLGNDC